MKYSLYFAYGSNLNQKQMTERCPHAELLGLAMLEGYRLAFCGHSRIWDGAVATIKKHSAKTVYGALYRLPVPELFFLDLFEGHPYLYKRSKMKVIGEMGDIHRAWVYRMRKKYSYDAEPSADYLQTIQHAHRLYQFDDDQLGPVNYDGGVKP